MWLILLGLLLLPVSTGAQVVQCFTGSGGTSTICYGEAGQSLQIFRSPDKQSGTYFGSDGSSGSFFGSGGSTTIYSSPPPARGLTPIPSMPAMPAMPSIGSRWGASPSTPPSPPPTPFSVPLSPDPFSFNNPWNLPMPRE